MVAKRTLPARRLSDRELSALVAEVPKGERWAIADTAEKGLLVLIGETGATFFARLDRSKQSKIGRHPTWGVKEARVRCRAMRAAWDSGLDLRAQERAAAEAEKAARAATMPVREAVAGWRQRKVVERRGKRRATLKSDTYILDLDRHLRKLIERLGDHPIREVTAADIERLLDAQPPGREANYLWGTLRECFAYLVRHRVIDRNVIEDVDRPPAAAPRARVPSLAEWGAVWNALDAHEGRTLNIRRLAGRFAIAVGCARIGEVVGLRWGHVDREGALWTMPSETTKNGREHVVPLGPLALEILADAERAAGRADPDGLVFPGLRGGPQTAPSKIVGDAAERAGVQDVRTHDLRRTFATILTDDAEAQRAGVTTRVLDQMLNHAASRTAPGVFGVYNRAESLEQKRAAMARWDHLLRVELGANVVKFPSGGSVVA